MIVVKIWGGLGNQLFQYAFGYMMKKKHDDELMLDISFFKKHQFRYVGKRFFELDKLHCNERIAKELPISIRIAESFLINRVLQRFPCDVNIDLGKTQIHKEAKRRFMSNVPYKLDKINYYDGYWQSGLYFEEYKSEFQKKFTPSIEKPIYVNELVDIINSCDNSVSVHIRRGDFRGHVGYVSDIEYYNEAVRIIKHKVGNPVFFVFSDDIEWVKRNINFDSNTLFVDRCVDNGAIFDMYCMTKCYHGIMSASTFSWWGNWLKEHQGIIIAPSGEYNNDKFISNNWLTI